MDELQETWEAEENAPLRDFVVWLRKQAARKQAAKFRVRPGVPLLTTAGDAMLVMTSAGFPQYRSWLPVSLVVEGPPPSTAS